MWARKSNMQQISSNQVKQSIEVIQISNGIVLWIVDTLTINITSHKSKSKQLLLCPTIIYLFDLFTLPHRLRIV